MPGTHARFQPPLEAVGCIPLLRRSSCKRTSLRDERLDLLLLQEVQQGDQILSKPCRSQPFEPLDAVGDHPFPATEKPAASDVQPEDGDATKAMTTTWTTGSQSPPPERGRQARGHDPPARTESLAGTPDVGPTDAVKNDVHARAREAVNFFHEVKLPVINPEIPI